VVSIATDTDKEFLSAVSKLAEIYTEESTVADRSNGEQSAGSHLTICVNGSPEGRFRIPTNEEDSSQDFSRIVGELSDPDQRWVLRDSPPAFPADVESEQYLTVKIQKDVPNPSLRDRLLLRLQGLKR
jgi:hypothetical protein